MNKHLVFCYGTLKRGFSRNNAMAEQRYLGIARTTQHYGMYAYGGYPALVDKTLAEASGLTAEKHVFGELYEVDDAGLVALDRIEGTDHGLFERRQVKLEDLTLASLPTNDLVWSNIANKSAMAYFFKKPLKGAADCGSLWTQK